MYPTNPFKYNDALETLVIQQNKADSKEFLKWLCQTPKTTTIRVNLVKTTRENVQDILMNELKERKVCPMPHVYCLKDLPDVIAMDSNQQQRNPINFTDIYVDPICASAILRGADIYAPGVLSMAPNTKPNDLVNVYADLCRIVLKGSKNACPKERAFIAIGKVKMQRHQLFGPDAVKSGVAIEIISTQSGVPSLNESAFSFGQAMLQNLPSIICGHVLCPQSDETVLDMCAAPGNKTTHLAALMNDTGALIALDRSQKKMKLLKQKIKQFDLKSVQCYACDSTQILSKEKLNSSVGRPPYCAETFDRILLDTPCSGLGNRPLLYCDISEHDLLSYPTLQKKLLSVGVQLLKPGGVLVYSTCSICHRENESIVAWAIEHFANIIELVPATPLLGGPGWDVGLSTDQRLMVQRFGPEKDNLRIPDNLCRDTIGFFIAKFMKKTNV